MNNTFDWNRFCEVVKKDFRNMWPLFGRTMLILALLPMTIWLLSLIFPILPFIPSPFRFFMIGMVTLLAACMTASRMYRTWNLQGEGVYFAMLPASKLEKYLSASIYSLLICPLLVFLCSLFIDVFLTLLPFGNYHTWLWEGYNSFLANSYFLVIFLIFFFNFLALIPLYMFMSTCFKRHKVLRTSLWLILFYFGSMLVRLKIFNSPSVGLWIDNLASNLGRESVANILIGIQLALPIIGFVLFGWLAWRRLNRMGY